MPSELLAAWKLPLLNRKLESQCLNGPYKAVPCACYSIRVTTCVTCCCPVLGG